jgi:hypothetical protein
VIFGPYAPVKGMNSAARFSILLRVLVFVSAVIAIIAACFLPTCYHRNNSGAWPTTTGVIRSAALTTAFHKPPHAPWFSPFICYTYTVDDIPRASTRIEFSDQVAALTKDEALTWIDRHYPVGKQVTVYYDSKDPDLAVLVPGSKDLIFIAWVSSGTAAFCCIASYLLLIRQRPSHQALRQ